jgi:hypothetical protein
VVEDPAGVVEHLADVDAAADELLARRVDVVHREHQVLDRAGDGRRHVLTEDDRRVGAGRRELDDVEVAVGELGVEPPAEARVEALRPVDVGDGQLHDLEPHGGGRGGLIGLGGLNGGHVGLLGGG